MKQNYQKMLEETIAKNQSENKVPALLLHSCCAPCSSYCLEYLSQYFKITVFYYNPNIYPEEEYFKRVKEQQRFIERLPAKYPVSFVEGNYDKERFYQMAQGLEDVKEGGKKFSAAMNCGSGNRPRLQINFIWIILQRHYPSVRLKMQKN